MNSKILLSVASIAVAGALIIGATFAYFSDTETSNGNTFNAGTLDLNVDGGNTNVVKFNQSNLKPSSLGGAHWILRNVGTVAGFLDFENKTVTNFENTCLEPENDTTCGTNDGELGANIYVSLYEDANSNGARDQSEDVYYQGMLDGLATATIADKPLAAGTEKRINMDWAVQSPVENIIQSDGLTLDMTFELGQTTAQ